LKRRDFESGSLTKHWFPKPEARGKIAEKDKQLK
jgi:hypothetical protein